MFRSLYFALSLAPVTIYYSKKMVQLDLENISLDKADAPGLAWGRKLISIAHFPMDVDLGDIRPGGHYVFIGNHQSNMDIPVLFSILDTNHIRFVAKKSLFDIPIYGKALAHAGHISIDRDNRRAAMESLNNAVNFIKTGISPLIFPEGTRNPTPEKLMDFKIGGMILALKCGLPVVPFVMTGTSKVMPKGTIFIKPRHTVRFKALPVIDSSTYTLKDRERFKDDLYSMMSEAHEKLMKKGN